MTTQGSGRTTPAERAPVLVGYWTGAALYAGRRACSTAGARRATLDGRAGCPPSTDRDIPDDVPDGRRHAQHPPSIATTTRQA